jgi:predicted transposase YdaD
LFKAINWMMTLPVELEERYWQSVHRMQQEGHMEWISPLEQVIMKKGLEQGREQGRKQGLKQGREEGAAILLAELLTKRFGPLPPGTRRKLARASLDQLTQWGAAAADAQTLKEVFS